MVEWNPERVQELLQQPQRLLREEPWRSQIVARGGLSRIYERLRTLPLGHDERRVLDALLTQPGESVTTYANRLGVHTTTYYRHLRRLVRALTDFLNADGGEEPGHVTQPRRWRCLPAVPTSFVGRTSELAAISALLRDGARLVTLTGLGGAGKTRISIQVATELADHFADGVVFVPLAAITAPELVAPAIAQVLGIKETGGQTTEATLLAHLADKQALLVLDNFEQISEAAGFVGQLLAGAPRLSIIVTSRTVLRLYGEQVYAIPPLPAPPPHELPALRELHEYEAIRLFVARARASDPTWTLDEHNAADLATICARLDGLPLALELAAARVRVLPPAALAARLDQRLSVLTGGARDIPQRQQSLRAMMDWSYHLLTPAQQQAFARLSVCAGGWSVEAAAAMLDLPADSLDLLENLSALLDNSLINSTPGAESRWTMLQIVREYALERLAERGEDEAMHLHFAEWITELAETAVPELKGPHQERWLLRLEQEHDNIRGALQWAIDHAAEVAVRLSGALWLFWWTHGHRNEGRRWLERSLAVVSRLPEIAPARLVRALNGAGALAWSQGDYEPAVRFFERCLAIQGDLGDTRGAAMTRNNLGLVAIKREDYAQAAAAFTENVAIFRDLGDAYSHAATLSNLGMVARYQGQYDQARELFEESLAMRRALANRWAIAASLTNLGLVALQQGQYGQARLLYRESLAILAELGERESIAECLEGLAGVRAAEGRPAAAARLCAAAAALRTAISAPLSPADQALYEQTLQSVRAALPAAEYDEAWSAGLALPLEQAVAAALAD